MLEQTVPVPLLALTLTLSGWETARRAFAPVSIA
jgi:hypothetical protein